MSRKFSPYILENIEIIDIGSEGKSIAKQDGMVIFVPMGVPGDIVDIRIIKKRKGYMEGIITQIKQPSPLRIAPRCTHFGVCGGCKWQILPYQQQLQFKQQQIYDNFKHLGKFEFPEMEPILGSENEYYYRNKLEFTFSDSRWLDQEDLEHRDQLNLNGLGFHVPGKFDKVVDIEHCYLQEDPSNQIRLAVKKQALAKGIPFYNIKTHTGILRNLIIRTHGPGQLMVILVVKSATPEVMELLQFLVEQFPEISSLHYVINTKLNDSISDLPTELFHGNPHVKAKMEELEFIISPVSFYQTNSQQAYRLYQVVREWAEIQSDEIVYDLYTGTGTIANFVAHQAKKVVGIEYVESAIEDAWVNSRNNGIENSFFIAGDIKDILTSSFVKEQGKPNVVITDPPRAGMHPAVVEQLLKILPDRIVYVSCNPATQARDITLLAAHYKVVKVQPVDMFPHTHHLENVVLLKRNTTLN